MVLIAAWQLPKLGFDYDFEQFFPRGDKELEFFLDYRDKFSPDTDFILVGVGDSTSIFKEDFLTKVDILTDSLEALPHVTSVNSPTNINSFVIGPFGPIQVPYLHLSKPELLPKDSIRISRSENMIGSFFSPDLKAVSLVVNTAPRMNKKDSDELATGLLRVLDNMDFKEEHTAGRMTGQLYIIEKMKRELALFISISLVILIIFLWVSFRSSWGVWVPIVVVLLTAVFLLALMSATGKSIDVLTAILPTILFVVGISDIVHIISRYLEELRAGKTKVDALRVTFKEIGLATFLTSFTTAVGFMTLLTVSIVPVQEFGIYTSAGVFIAFFLSFSLLPAILMLNKKPQLADRKHGQLFWHPKLASAFAFTLRNKRLIMVGSTLLVLLSLWGISRIEVNNFLLEDLSNDDPHKQDFLYFEEKFAGVRPFEMYVKLEDTTRSVFDYEVIQDLEKVNHYLRSEYGAGFLVSPVSFVKTANQAFHGGNPEYYRVPEDEKAFQKIESVLKRIRKSKEVKRIVAENGYETRFTGKMEDFGGKRIKQLNTELMQFIDTELIDGNYQFELTGTALLIDKNNEYLARDMMLGLLIAFMVIGVIMGLLYRSFVIVILALIPNILPLLAIGGIMGFSGIDLKVSTSIIFTIAFGIAVDDTIHFMSKLKLELNKGRSLLYALKRTYISTGKAILVTSIILCSGFVSLVFSTFASTFYVGVLVSITLFFAVLIDLTLLPVLLLLFYKPYKSSL